MLRTPRFVALASLVFLGAGGLLLTGCTSQIASPPASAADAQTNTVTVLGRGEVTHKPDIARATVGIEVSAPTVVEASRSAAQRMTELIAALKKTGIADKDIQTSNYSINFERVYPQPQPAPMALPALAPAGKSTPAAKGAAVASPPAPPPPAEPAGLYRVSNTVSITVRELDKVGSVLDAAVAAGANSVWGISFGLDKPEALEPEARAKAVADARARAESLAKLAGRTLGDVVSVSEIIRGGGGVPMFSSAMAKSGSYDATPVELGEVAVSTQVEVVYRFAPPVKPE